MVCFLKETTPSVLREVVVSSTIRTKIKNNRVLPRELTGHSKHPLPTTQEKTLHTGITKWSILKSIDYICCSQRWRTSIESAKAKLGADCGSDHELFIDRVRPKLKKAGKITRPFRYDLNEIAYDYTVEVRNRFKGSDLTDRGPEELWMEVHDFTQEAGIKTIPKKDKGKKGKWLSAEVL